MNKTLSLLNSFSRFLLPVLTLAVSIPACAQGVQNPKNAQGEQFFMISSVDLPKHHIILMAPTQLTLVANTTNLTQFVGEKGQKLTEKDLKAGDTVWAIVKTAKDGETTAVKIREGAMTPADLHKLYLSHPSNALPPLPNTMQSAVPVSSAGQASAQTRLQSTTPGTAGVTSGAFGPGSHPAGVAHARKHHHGTGHNPNNS
ncbi:MAG: hypothetical protein WBD23_12425 [Candidatus Acidiferrales bacterium]